MLNGHHCGNCKYWVDTKTTIKGTLPYFGKCEKGRPFRQGKFFIRKGHKFRYCDFTVRTDKCKDWSSNK